MKDSKSMINKEISFMKKKGAPKSMIKHEMAERSAMGKKPPMPFKKATKESMPFMPKRGSKK
jgi:hypothetical protein